MFKHYFERISTDIVIYPLISFAIFFLFFLGLLIWVVQVDKNYINEMKNIPLDK
jgi:cytochrome c oxidase cbb3-type subunit 4